MISVSVGLIGTVNGNLKLPFNPIEWYKEFKIFKYHPDTIQIHLAIIPPRTIQIIQWYLNGIFVRVYIYI